MLKRSEVWTPRQKVGCPSPVGLYTQETGFAMGDLVAEQERLLRRHRLDRPARRHSQGGTGASSAPQASPDSAPAFRAAQARGRGARKGYTTAPRPGDGPESLPAAGRRSARRKGRAHLGHENLAPPGPPGLSELASPLCAATPTAAPGPYRAKRRAARRLAWASRRSRRWLYRRTAMLGRIAHKLFSAAETAS